MRAALTQAELIPVIRDIVHAQLQLASPARFGALRRSAVPIDTALRESDLDLDSLELIRVGNAIANFFNLHDAGVEDLLLTDTSVAGFARVVAAARNEGNPFQVDAVCDFTFASSGSTGKSSFWRHHESWLDQEVQYWRAKLAEQSTPVKRVVSCVPRCHVYGFIWTVLLPKALGIEVIELFPEQLFPHKLSPGDLVIATPSVWTAWDSLSFRWPNGMLGISSTAPLPASAAKSLLDAGLPIIEIYGSTENAGIASRHSSQPYFELMSHYEFEQTSKNQNLEINLIRHCPDQLSRRFNLLDEIRLKQDQNSNENLATTRGTVASKHFVITGRKDHVVQVNGYNVSTLWVSQLINELDGVSECVVRKMNADEGEHLKACLVLDGQAREAQVIKHVSDWCRENLPENSRPKHYQVAKQIPRNEMGKLADWSVELAPAH